MTGSTLRFWSSFSKEKLTAAVAAEEARLRSGQAWYIEDQQLLDAARERLLSWREPHRTKRKEVAKMTDTETKSETELPLDPPVQKQQEPESAPEKTPEKEESADETADAPRRTRAPRRSDAEKSEEPQKTKRGARQASVPEKEKSKMARKKEAAAPVKGKAKAAASEKSNGANGRERIKPDAKLVKASGENPFNEGSGPHQRTAAVLKAVGARGATREALEKLDIKPTTIPTLVKLGVLRVA
jgi:hypothetical protein